MAIYNKTGHVNLILEFVKENKNATYKEIIEHFCMSQDYKEEDVFQKLRLLVKLGEIVETMNNKRVVYNIKNNIDPTWAIIKNQYAIFPIYGGAGRVLIQEDPFKSRFDCSKCQGQRHLGVICPRCKGTKVVREEACWECAVASERVAGVTGGKESLGFVPCDQCNGVGGSIVIPDESKRNTTTGNVLAVSSSDILHVKVGNKVMFTSYAGSPFKFLDVDLRVIVERDLLCLVKPLKKNIEGLNEGTFADLQNTGVAR